ncbi:MAG: MFS transporter [Planctomycetota bacterium]
MVVERFTAYHHLRAALLLGGAQGVFTFNEYVARRELGAGREHIVALLLAPAMAQTLATFWNPADPGRLLGRRPFRILGMGGQSPVALLALVAALGVAVGATPFVAVLALASVCGALLIPTQGAILSNNYPAARRSQRFSAAVALQAAGLVVVSVPLGYALDERTGVWPYAWFVGAVLAALGYARWGQLRRRRPPPPPTDLVAHRSPWRTLRHDRRFLVFEAAFMVYGIGFLALQPVLPLYLLDELHVDYTQVALARGALFWIAMIVASPFAGRLGDRFGVLRLGAFGFALLGAFAAILLVWRDIAGVYVGFVVFGLAMSCVNVAWNLGPIALAQGRDPLPYLNAHIGLIGIRAVIGMVGGTWAQQELGSAAVFQGTIVLEALAVLTMVAAAGPGGRPWRARGRRAEDVPPPAPEASLPPAP